MNLAVCKVFFYSSLVCDISYVVFWGILFVFGIYIIIRAVCTIITLTVLIDKSRERK